MAQESSAKELSTWFQEKEEKGHQFFKVAFTWTLLQPVKLELEKATKINIGIEGVLICRTVLFEIIQRQ